MRLIDSPAVQTAANRHSSADRAVFLDAIRYEGVFDEVATNMRICLRRAGLTQREAAARLGTSETALSRMLRGRNVKNVKFETVVRFARAVGVDVLTLIQGEVPAAQPPSAHPITTPVAPTAHATRPDSNVRMAHVRKVEEPLRVLFPPDRPSSPSMVALLVRYDELLFLLNQFGACEREEAARAAAGDPRPVLWRFMLSRLLLVAADDALEKLSAIMRDEEVQRLVAEAGAPGDEFKRELRALRSKQPTTRKLRDQFGAHLDPEPIVRALRSPIGQAPGTLWMANLGTDCQYDAAHHVVAAALSFHQGAAPTSTEAESLVEFKRAMDAAVEVQLALPRVIRTLLLLFERTAGAVENPA